ncbi:transposase domain-containing protein [Salmonella enterica subsp. diarizonae]|nr:transposase domain-containing protein [Salmonella enterica]EBH8951705.1 transposase domain-containing protein [Salmonella enterica subsp. diarizonae serovar 48:i:z]ECJ4443202.1 transposase domain-containing protein [Salmonella enterica subsp. diarizonae]ECU0486145.1 transposase domain-containing protein [Salmonella enterica]ECV0000691.1 transposase domain-containing protein [Salmonella enterica subsp. diarizonae serovar 48:i:z]
MKRNGLEPHTWLTDGLKRQFHGPKIAGGTVADDEALLFSLRSMMLTGEKLRPVR